VFDLWVQQWRKRYACGDVVVTRFADDFAVGFQHREEAERFLALLIEMRDSPAVFMGMCIRWRRGSSSLAEIDPGCAHRN
jgi:hypothetical protein